MRRSSAPSQKGKPLPPCFLKSDEDKKPKKGLTYKSNASAIQKGNVAVARAPFLLGLSVPKQCVDTKFRLPSQCEVSETCKQMRLTKTLGVRPGGKILTTFRRVAVGKENEMVFNIPVETQEPKTIEEKLPEEEFEPLILWKSDNQENGSEPHAVQVAPILCSKLRQHQREGVQFMFECVMGLREYGGNGCILADDMGLGKTLQSITVLYTLLKQGFEKKPTAKKAIVVCPTSLVNNWDKEIKKWKLDINAVPICESGKDAVTSKIRAFLYQQDTQVCIISYETFRLHLETFEKRADHCCDLLICDEAHRLKNADTITNRALASLKCRRRILLSGTPLQNDLDEFYAMVDFANPGILGTPNDFRKKFVRHILAGREPDATDTQIAKAQTCQNEMSTLVNEFILRRTNTLNAQHLPPKLVQIVCCSLTSIQRKIYKHLLSSKDVQHILNGKQTNILCHIGALQKLCNHPSLLLEGATGSSTRGTGAVDAGEIASLLPVEEGRGRQRAVRPELSGKMKVLERLMWNMRDKGNERIVVVSNYTMTLDMIANLCRERNWPYTRLDGSTSVNKRQKMVDAFNDPTANSFAFLLSSKAGGCGLNLIGANRLVLFDPDWNPAVDKQAAARVWRDGQKKRCFIYRFVTTGTIEEKIFMRQLSKEGLQSIVDDKEEVNSLSSKDLRKLFKFNESTISDTHEKLECERCPKKSAQQKRRDEANEVSFNASQKREVLAFLSKIMARNDSKSIKAQIEQIREDEGVGTSTDPFDFAIIEEKLQQGAFTTLPAFSKEVNGMLAMGLATANRIQDDALSNEINSLKKLFDHNWRRVATNLISMKGEDGDDRGESEQALEEADGGEEKEGPGETKFQPQIGMPAEEDLNSWSHHHSVDTIDDEIMREALKGKEELISFVFGLEVTWDLLQRHPQAEVKPKKRRVQEGSSEKKPEKKPKTDKEKKPGRKGRKKLKESEPSEDEDEAEKDEEGEDEEEGGDPLEEEDGDPPGGDIDTEKDDDDDDDDDNNEDEEKEVKRRPPAPSKEKNAKKRLIESSDDDDEVAIVEEKQKPAKSKGRPKKNEKKRKIIVDEEDEEDEKADDISWVEPLCLGSDEDEELVVLTAKDEDKQESAKKRTPSSACTSQDDNASDSVTGSWNCTSCTFLNEKRKRKCMLCGTKKPPVSHGKSQSQSSQNEDNGSKEENPDQAFANFMKLMEV